jgi:hypothetical protein
LLDLQDREVHLSGEGHGIDAFTFSCHVPVSICRVGVQPFNRSLGFGAALELTADPEPAIELRLKTPFNRSQTRCQNPCQQELRRQNELWSRTLAGLESPVDLDARVKRMNLGLMPPRPDQVVRLTENVPEAMSPGRRLYRRYDAVRHGRGLQRPAHQ